VFFSLFANFRPSRVSPDDDGIFSIPLPFFGHSPLRPVAVSRRPFYLRHRFPLSLIGSPFSCFLVFSNTVFPPIVPLPFPTQAWRRALSTALVSFPYWQHSKIACVATSYRDSKIFFLLCRTPSSGAASLSFPIVPSSS